MDNFKEQAVVLGTKISHSVLVGYYYLEKQFNEYIKPKLQKMSAKCWIGTVALIALGYLLAKIF